MTNPTRPRRTLALALALTFVLAVAGPAAAAPPARDSSAFDRATAALEVLWNLFFGSGSERLGGASDEGPIWDPNGVEGGSAGTNDNGLTVDPGGPEAASDGDAGPIWDPNG